MLMIALIELQGRSSTEFLNTRVVLVSRSQTTFSFNIKEKVVWLRETSVVFNGAIAI